MGSGIAFSQKVYKTTRYENYGTHKVVKKKLEFKLDLKEKKIYIPEPYDQTYDIVVDEILSSKQNPAWKLYSNGKYTGFVTFYFEYRHIEVVIDGTLVYDLEKKKKK